MNFTIEVSEKKVFKEYLRREFPLFWYINGCFGFYFIKKVLVVLKYPLDLVPVSSFYRSRYSNWLEDKWSLFDVDFFKTLEVKNMTFLPVRS